jgi:hypothetical protein
MKINSIAASSLVVLSLLLTAAGAHAQSASKAHVPFAFKVGKAQMPAGNYLIDREMGSAFITVRNLQTGTTTHALARRESPSKKTDKLIFHHYGSQYVLAEIWGTAGSDGVALYPTKESKDLELAQGPPSAGTYVEIASN